jgi:hypothetical protein
MMCWELFGISNLGGGAIKQNPSYMKHIIIPNPKKFVSIKQKIKEIGARISKRETLSIFKELGFDLKKPIKYQTPNPLPDRAELDKIIFTELGINESDINEFYRALGELVYNRLYKAKRVEQQ